jgi:uncharacterized membrane protein
MADRPPQLKIFACWYIPLICGAALIGFSCISIAEGFLWTFHAPNMLLPIEIGFTLLLLSAGGILFTLRYEQGDTDRAIRPRPKHLAKNRVEAVSDGVFSVALTLLVVDIATTSIPHMGSGWWPMFWPKLLAFVYSFWVVAVYWIAHHGELNMLVDLGERMREFLYVNLLFLLFIVMLPFSTAVLGSNWSVPLDATDKEDAGLIGWLFDRAVAVGPLDADFWYIRIPFLIYALNLLLAGAAMYLLWWYIREGKAGKVDEDHRHEFEITTYKNWLIPGTTLLVVVIGVMCRAAFAQWTIGLVPLAYMGWTLWYARYSRRRRERQGEPRVARRRVERRADASRSYDQ